MADYKVSNFKGIRPRRSALKLPKGEAQTSSNTKLGSGDVESWLIQGDEFPVFNTYFNKTVHLFEDDDSNPKWLEWDTYVSVARGTVKGDSTKRTYYTGDGAPKMTYDPIAINGGGPFPSDFRLLGIPVPAVAPTVAGTSLPESVDPSLRRTLPNSMITKLFEAVFVDYTVYPGTGTADEQWNLATSGAGDITFDLQPGFAAKVLEVIDADTVTLGSSTGTGAFAVTAANDQTDTAYWQPMDNNGNTQAADFNGWRIPDGLKVTIIGHLLRVGDVIRVTRSDFSAGILFPFTVTTDFFEQSWTSPVQVTIGDSTFYQTPNGRIAASADGTTDFAALNGGFYYDVDRTASNSSILEDRQYVYTYVSALGEEGPPSTASSILPALDGDTVTITGMELPPTLGYEITRMRLYRTNSTAAGTEYQFVKEFDTAASTTESVLAANLGEILGSTTWDAPHAEMQGITSMPNGMMVGFRGKNVYFCEPYQPHAYPADYDQAVDYDIIALARFGNSIAILTEGVPYIITGSHPRNANIRPYEINQACSSPRSVASSVDRVIYASPDGLIELGVNGAKNVTEQYLSKVEWADYAPTDIVGEFHDGKYFGFFGGADAVTQPPVTLLLTGTMVTAGDLADEADIVAGGKTLILTLVSDTWLAAGAAFEATRQSIIDGIVSSTSFYTGWNTILTPGMAVGEVVRTSSTVVTITVALQAGYSLIAPETMTITIPGTALTAGDSVAADTTFTVGVVEDYSSEVMVATVAYSGQTDVPYAINSGLDITDWDEYAGLSTTAAEIMDITGLAYSTSQDRWLACGLRDTTATELPNTAAILTSDDRGVTWTKRFHQFMADTDKKPRSAIRYDEYDTYAVCGDNRSLQVSSDGETWVTAAVDGTIPATQTLEALVRSESAITKHIYAACASANFLIRSPDLATAPASNTWTAVATPYAAAVGTDCTASGGGKVLSVGSSGTNFELCQTLHGASAATYVGAIASFLCKSLVMGGDLWVAVATDGTVRTCANGDEGTIGNWSAASAAIVAGLVVGSNAIAYDQGDTITQGYGYIVAGTTAGGLPVVYTSPDAVTWTLRFTGVGDDASAIAVRYPEDQTGDPRIDYSPTYNGAQSPTQLGDTTSDYEFTGLKGQARGNADTSLVVYHTPANTIIKIGGFISGNTDLISSLIEADATIFTLGVPCDSVRIVKVDLDTGTSDTGYEGTAGRIGDFIDSQFFDISDTPYTDVGYTAHAYARAVAYNGMGGLGVEIKESESIGTYAFTFRKAGYNDLTVTYKVRGYAIATSTTTAP